MSNIRRIIELFFEQSQSEDTRKEFIRWLKSPHAVQEKEEVISRIWDELHIEADDSTENSYKQVEKRLDFAKRKEIRTLFIRFARIAAVIFIPLFSVLSAWWFVHNQPAPELTLIECFVPNGEIRDITLPDNSKVRINSGSTLFYPSEFRGKKREIYLSGEAKFMVAQDTKRPFVVKTNDMNVEALGTVFNIFSYPDNLYTTATLAEGKIKVDIKSTDESFILEPHEQIQFDKKSAHSLQQQARLDYVLAWEKGQMVFQKATLYDIVKEIERRFDVTIYLNSKAWEHERITVKFLNDESLDEILMVFKHIVTGFNYEIKGDKIYIY